MSDCESQSRFAQAASGAYNSRIIYEYFGRGSLLNTRLLREKNAPLLFIVAAFFILALVYAWATPPLEASDELWHFGMVNFIADTGQLPVQHPGLKTAWEQEGSQPPLYYLLSAVLVAGIDRSDFAIFTAPNPHVIAGIPGAVGNKNLILHTSPHPSLQRTTLAVAVLRLFSIMLGCITISAVYACARELQPRRLWVAVLSAALTAFNPMFLFISASVNNDNLVTALNSLILWQMLVMLRKGISLRRTLLIGVLLGLTALSKLSGLVLLPVIVLAMLYVFFTSRRPSFKTNYLQLVGSLLTIMGLIVLVAGWWYVRNLTLYGELFGTSTMVAVAGAREGNFTLGTLFNEFQGFRFAYWALFGAFNIMTFRWFYDVMDVLTILAMLGLVFHVWRSRFELTSLIGLGLFALAIIGGAVGVISWTAQTYASQGRLLFPFVAAISPLLALGLVSLFDLVASKFTALKPTNRSVQVFPILLAGFALVVPFASIAPQYAPPEPLTQLPSSAHQIYARFDTVELVGYETPDQRYMPGDWIPVTVYWKVREPSQTDLSLFVQAVLDDGTVIGKVDSYPGAGRLQTTTWQPGALYADTYSIPLGIAADQLSGLRIRVGWWDYATGLQVDATNESGEVLRAVMLDAGGFGSLQPPIYLSPNYTPVQSASFGGLVELTGYQLDGDNLTLAWRVLSAFPADETVFVQVLDSQNQVIGQGDAPPALPSRYFRAGEYFFTQHSIAYPSTPSAGEYRLVIGWYNPVGFARLDTDQPDDAYALTTLTLP